MVITGSSLCSEFQRIFQLASSVAATGVIYDSDATSHLTNARGDIHDANLAVMIYPINEKRNVLGELAGNPVKEFQMSGFING